MLRAVQLNLKAENDEILNSWMNWDNINVYYVKNAQKTMIISGAELDGAEGQRAY